MAAILGRTRRPSRRTSCTTLHWGLCSSFLLWSATDYKRSGLLLGIPASVNLPEIAGEQSDLAKKHKVWLHRVGVTNLPDDYETRLTQMHFGQSKNLTLFAPDPYDYILSKLDRNSSKDRDDAAYLFKQAKLDSKILRARYENELRPYLADQAKHDLTLDLWIDIFGSKPPGSANAP